MLKVFAFFLPLIVQALAADTSYITDCSNITKQGIYKIRIDRDHEFDVLCDDDLPDGGWTYILNRNTGKINFHELSYQDYRKGFGKLDLDEEYFIGLENWHLLTKYDSYNLLIKMQDFDGNSYMTQVFGFALGQERFRYTYMNIDGYEGTEIGINPHGSSFCARGIRRCENARHVGWTFDGEYSPKTKSRLNIFGAYPKAGVPIDQYTMGFYNDENDILVPLRAIKILMRKKKILFHLSEEVVFKRV